MKIGGGYAGNLLKYTLNEKAIMDFREVFSLKSIIDTFCNQWPPEA